MNFFGIFFYEDGSSVNPASIYTKTCVEKNGNAFTHSNTDLNFEHDRETNIKYCGKPKCRFLFAYYQPEQETKANMHYRSFISLAHALNRTMVLTNVGSSRINSCQNLSFDAYYDSKELRNTFPEVHFISQNDFQNWLKERVIKPNTEHAYILPGQKNFSVESIKPYPDILKKKNCLSRFDFRLDDTTTFKQFYTESKFYSNIKKHTAFANFLVDNLRSDVEVLLTSHFVFHPLFPKDTPPIPYAPYISDEAAKITNKIKPYIAIHWRMERAKIDLLQECAQSLVEAVNSLKETHGIQNVYLATDYPTGGGKTQSSTFHKLTGNHHKAMEIVNSELNVYTWVSMDIFSNIKKDESMEKEFLGAGISGIVDKLVCINSDYFLATPKGCGREKSTYTTMVIDSRNNSILAGDKPELKNIVMRWPLRSSS
ncbi:10605_t:CDS:2, partial [Acaulospora morrowiae]